MTRASAVLVWELATDAPRTGLSDVQPPLSAYATLPDEDPTNAELLVLVRRGDVLAADAVEMLEEAFRDPEVVLACCTGPAVDRHPLSGRSDDPCDAAAPSVVVKPGDVVIKEWLGSIKDPRWAGPVAVRRSSLAPAEPRTRVDLGSLLAVLEKGNGTVYDVPLLAAVAALPKPRRWLSPDEVSAWLKLLDEYAVRGILSPEHELLGTIALLRRAVLIDDLIGGGPRVQRSILTIEHLAERIDSLQQHRAVDRASHPGYTAVTMSPDHDHLLDPHVVQAFHPPVRAVTRIGPTVLFIGPGATAGELSRFIPGDDEG